MKPVSPPRIDRAWLCGLPSVPLNPDLPDDHPDNLHVTLDGLPAAISGTSLDFALVGIIGKSWTVTFAWPTADHIVRNCNGEFKS